MQVLAIGSTLFLLLLLLAIMFLLFNDFKNFIQGYPPFLPSGKQEVERMLSIYHIRKEDRVVDLGSGDARILIKLAERGVRSHGYETNPLLVFLSKILIRSKKLSQHIKIFRQDLLKADLSSYNVFLVYGIRQLMPKLEEKLLKEAPKGSVIISNKFTFPNLEYKKNFSTTYLYKL